MYRIIVSYFLIVHTPAPIHVARDTESLAVPLSGPGSGTTFLVYCGMGGFQWVGSDEEWRNYRGALGNRDGVLFGWIRLRGRRLAHDVRVGDGYMMYRFLPSF